jgi:GGDEF domain-containing protein
MKYRKLELLLMSVGLIAILISIFTSLLNGAQIDELIGQALFVPVLILALHYGRHYGYTGAIVAALILLIIKTQKLGDLNLANSEGRQVLMQAVAFGLVGIFGGELAVRMKYVMAKITNEQFVDDDTKVFSERYVHDLIGRLLSGYHRHHRPFAILFIEVSWPKPISEHSKAKQLGRIANIIRGNVRLVDEVGYLNDGRFCLVLPDATCDSANIVYERLKKLYGGSQHYFHVSAEWSCDILGLPEDESAIAQLATPFGPIEVIA